MNVSPSVRCSTLYVGWDAGAGWELSMREQRRRDGEGDNMPRVSSTGALR
jgi:hypothetical protein